MIKNASAAESKYRFPSVRNPYSHRNGKAILFTGIRIHVNISIVRTFVRLRKILATHQDLARKVEEHDRQIGALLNAVQKLLAPPAPAKKYPIGYIHPKDRRSFFVGCIITSELTVVFCPSGACLYAHAAWTSSYASDDDSSR